MATSSRSCEVRVDTLEKTVKASQRENQALKSQINSVNTMTMLFLCMITVHIDFQVLSIISLKSLIKYINMQPDWPPRSLIITES